MFVELSLCLLDVSIYIGMYTCGTFHTKFGVSVKSYKNDTLHVVAET